MTMTYQNHPFGTRLIDVLHAIEHAGHDHDVAFQDAEPERGARALKHKADAMDKLRDVLEDMRAAGVTALSVPELLAELAPVVQLFSRLGGVQAEVIFPVFELE